MRNGVTFTLQDIFIIFGLDYQNQWGGVDMYLSHHCRQRGHMLHQNVGYLLSWHLRLPFRLFCPGKNEKWELKWLTDWKLLRSSSLPSKGFDASSGVSKPPPCSGPPSFQALSSLSFEKLIVLNLKLVGVQELKDYKDSNYLKLNFLEKFKFFE